jgi:alanine-glyoxylate transaminase/serine-glyoxylate transaminase/serine-pyruvate transaminase
VRAVARTKHHVATYVANGHGVWEASLMNILSRGDRVLCLATGQFGLGWANVASQLGLVVDVIDFGRNGTIDFDQVRAALAADTGGKIRAVLATHVDTATSVRNDIKALRDTIDATGHGALLAVDCIASLGCDRFEMDA